jgi:hypothetical protein
MALDFLENKTYAVYFINIEAGYDRDYWLQRKAGVIVIDFKGMPDNDIL